MSEQKFTILGQDPTVLLAMLANILSWLVATYAPKYLPKLLPSCDEEETPQITFCVKDENSYNSRTKCISIGRPGGLEQLRIITLKKGIVTVGYNVKHFCKPPFTPPLQDDNKDAPKDCVILQNKNFSVNYADCAIRWGLYESANRFVGWPIVPGFDVAGTIEYVNNDNDNIVEECIQFKNGDRVFGVTLFGSYSNRKLIPKIQLRKIPKNLTFAQAASLPTVSLTALYALSLAGYFPITNMKYSNNAILIHSAAGGVGSMLVQISKLLGLSPIIGVVGRSSKVDRWAALLLLIKARKMYGHRQRS